jgi:hypothetical protein
VPKSSSSKYNPFSSNKLAFFLLLDKDKTCAFCVAATGKRKSNGLIIL